MVLLNEQTGKKISKDMSEAIETLFNTYYQLQGIYSFSGHVKS